MRRRVLVSGRVRVFVCFELAAREGRHRPEKKV
jgi:hypothetical protein